MSDDPKELILNNVWWPTLTVTGKGELPEYDEAGNFLWKSTYLAIS